ncbi:MAG: thiamine pyrophosphate-binding protein [Planctomycetota bacterium]
MVKQQSIGQYLLNQLHQRGVRHIFGIPGDYVLGFYEMIGKSRIKHIGTTREDSAGLAADAYARVNGIGAVCVTYCVGGLNITNPIAGAYAEKSAVVVISGAPGLKERERNPLLHHRVRDFATQKEIFEKITVASAALDDPLTAFHEVDRVLHALERYRRPVYFEIPRDMVHAARPHVPRREPPIPVADPETLQEAIAEATRMINASKRPVIIAGVEVHRFGLQDSLVKLIQKTNIPVAATLLGKSVISEAHPMYIGIYEGAMGRKEVTDYVESSDCVILLGAFMTDINLGIYTANLDQGASVYATSEKVTIRRHSYEDIRFRDFFAALLKAKFKHRKSPKLPEMHNIGAEPEPPPDSKMTVKNLFRELDGFITKDMVVVSDIGDCLFGAVDMKIRERTEFISPAYYTSMGFGVPAAIGAQLANPKLRPLVVVGDGAFQMTGLELSTAVRLKQNPIVVVLNNEGYSTERHIADGPFNDIGMWAYSKVPELLDAGKGFEVKTQADLVRALRTARDNDKTFSIINVHLDKYDKSPALARLAERLAARVKGKE